MHYFKTIIAIITNGLGPTRNTTVDRTFSKFLKHQEQKMLRFFSVSHVSTPSHQRMKVMPYKIIEKVQ